MLIAKIQTVREIEVLKAIRDSSAPFLVYADREAVTHATPELPPPLKVENKRVFSDRSMD